jgi:FixJ family two-component response regulator
MPHKKINLAQAAPLQYYFPWINKHMNNKTEIVYVVDDDEAVRDSLTWLLESNGYTVKCQPSAERFLQALQGDHKETVSCLILDVRMPGMSGLELQERLLAEGIPMPISFITGHGDVSMAVSTMKKGAIDFIEKPFKESELKVLVEKMLARARVDYAKADTQKNTQNLLSKLTGREKQVLERIVAGRLNKQIADDLNISIKTVEAHRANIMEKLNVNTVADLLRLALSESNK